MIHTPHRFFPLLIAAVALAAASPALAADGPVTLADQGNVFILSNGIVTAHINKRTGDLEQLWYKNIDTMGHDQGRAGYWEQDPSAAAKVGGLSQSVTIDPAKNNGERAEVSIKGVTKGDPTAGLTPGSPGAPATGTVNMDMEIRYTMGRGDSGVYVYAIFSHAAEYGPLNVPESRFITKINQSFDWISVDADRNMLEAAPTDWGQGVVVHAKEQRIMSKGVYKNSVEHKYSYTGTQYKIPAFGWSSTKNHVGIWFINPTIEYLSGGASKQELVCHFGDNDNPDPIILNYWRGTHFGGGASANIPAGESWTKVVGPMMVYVNSLDNPKNPTQSDLETLQATAGNPTIPPAWTDNATDLWKDALAQAAKEKSKWPYDWVEGVDYPHKNERGNVKGQLVLVDPQAKSTKLPNLTIGLAFPDPAPGAGGGGGRGRGGAPVPTPAGGAMGTFDDGTIFTAAPGGGAARGGFAPGGRGRGGPGGGGGFGGGGYTRDAKHYQFWNDGNDDGTFTITMVRPGKYTLHAWADGVLGEFAKADITVEAGKDVDLGKIEWKPVRNGQQIWEIGIPNRTASEFFKGDGANYWLWGWPLRYALLYPKGDLVYTVGVSDYHKDWFFEQTPRATSLAFVNPDAKDPANQRFGWVKAESLQQYPQTDTQGPWRVYGRGSATTWTINFNMEKPGQGAAALRVALAGADGGGFAVTVNGQNVGNIVPAGTNALRYNTDKGVWQERTLNFNGALLKAGENKMQFTVPAAEMTSGVVWDYLRLELNEQATPAQ